MISIKTDQAASFTSKSGITDARNRAGDAFRLVIEGTGEGKEWLGWRRILEHPDQVELNRIGETASRIRRNADIFIVCGIGGSYLGSKAVIKALSGPFGNRPEILFAGHHMGGRYLEQLTDYLEIPGPDGNVKSVYLNVISKSGSTLETALSFRHLRRWMDQQYGEEASRRIIITTGPEGGVLNGMAAEYGYEKFIIPDDVGGRFSVLTPVGLLPIAVAGIDIGALTAGAQAKHREICESANEILEYAAYRYYFHENGKILDVIGSFEPGLNAFTGWVQQLLGESEGKEGKGLFPVPVSYSTDLHSVGQMVQDGRRNLIETLLVVNESFSGLQVGDDGENSDGLGYLSGKPFHEINRQALNGTIEAHVKGGVPVIRIRMDRLDEASIGELICFYQYFTSVYVYMLEINPFDQPGVEDYKKAMFRNLGKG